MRLVIPIVQTGTPTLRTRAREVPVEEIVTPAMQQLVAQMIETMREAPGVGLAAPQIDVPLRVIVLEERQDALKNLTEDEAKARGRMAFDTRVFFNPVLTPIGDQKALFFEGCLSVSGFVALVERHLEVEVSGHDQNAEPVTWRVKGWPARILQHECDHIDGTLYIDRMKTRSFATTEHAQAHFAGKSIADVCSSLGI